MDCLHNLMCRYYRQLEDRYDCDLYFAVSPKGEFFLYLTEFGKEFEFKQSRNIYLPYYYKGYRVATYKDKVE